MTERGSDGRRPPTERSPPTERGPPLVPPPEGGRYEGREPGVMPPPSVIPAKAGIHLHMARRVSDTQIDGWIFGWIPVCTGMTERGPDRKRARRKEGDREVKGEGTFLSPAFSPLRKNGDQKERARAQSGKGSGSAKRAPRTPRRPPPRLPPGDRNVPPPLPAPLPLQLKAVLVIGGGALAAGGFQIQLHAGR